MYLVILFYGMVFVILLCLTRSMSSGEKYDTAVKSSGSLNVISNARYCAILQVLMSYHQTFIGHLVPAPITELCPVYGHDPGVH